MRCPNCRLENPPTAERCDCGYDFPSGKIKASYLPAGPPRRRTKTTFLIYLGMVLVISLLALLYYIGTIGIR